MDKTMDKKVRSIFLSDLHILSKFSQMHKLMAKLDTLDLSELKACYLVGDIVDTFVKKWYLNESCGRFVRKILKWSEKIPVTILVGNHDEAVFNQFKPKLGQIFIQDYTFHTLANGELCYICHGHKWDGNILNSHPILYQMGSFGYQLSLWLDSITSKILRRTHFSLSNFLKRNAKQYVNFLTKHNECMVKECEKWEATICIHGHAHNASVSKIRDVVLYDIGDFVSGCTFLVEYNDGTLEHIYA